MSRYCDYRRRDSTLLRDARVHELYDRIMSDLGDLRVAVSRSYVYDKIREETGLCAKTIAFILNHTVR